MRRVMRDSTGWQELGGNRGKNGAPNWRRGCDLAPPVVYDGMNMVVIENHTEQEGRHAENGLDAR